MISDKVLQNLRHLICVIKGRLFFSVSGRNLCVSTWSRMIDFYSIKPADRILNGRYREFNGHGYGYRFGDLIMKENRHRREGFMFLVFYLVLLTYFLFFSGGLGRNPETRDYYSYNLTLFKEIRRFIMYRDILGSKAVFLNIIGNILAFMPFGFILPEVWAKLNNWRVVTFMGFLFSLGVEFLQLITKVGSFDVDDLMLNTIGTMMGYLIFKVAKGVWDSYRGENWK